MTFTANNSNTIIDGNVVSKESVYNGSISTTYLYDSALYLNANANIANNHFSGVTSNSSTTKMIQVVDASGNFTNNTFARGNSSINAYLYSSGTLNQNIVDNAFDGYTVDGSSEILVQGLATGSVFTKNKNQIEYVPISLVGKLIDRTSPPQVTAIFQDTADSVNHFLEYLNNYITLSIFNSVANNINFFIDLNSCLPDGITLQECKIGVFAFNSGTLTSASLHMILNSQSTVPANYSTGTNSLLDSQNRRSTTNETPSSTIDLAAAITALTTSTQYYTISPISTSNFVNNKNNNTYLNIYLSTDVNAIGTLVWYLSPVVAKCIW